MGKKILIIDDDDQLAQALSRVLIQDGWTTAIAVDGADGITKVAEFAPDVILSDIKMPVLNGLEFLAELYKQNIEIPLIFMTGFRDFEYMKQAWSLCAFDFLDKPFNQANLLQVADNALKFGRDYVRTARRRYSTRRKVG